MPRKRRGEAELREVQRLGEAKDRLIAAMSHDLRSPLGSILVWLELLRSHELEPAATP